MISQEIAKLGVGWWIAQTSETSKYVCGYGDREIITVQGLNADEARFIALHIKQAFNSPDGYYGRPNND
tara:strand:+ start:234 stop:440 length:207 start_codon:yes stop_codon:yes gene_type:complete